MGDITAKVASLSLCYLIISDGMFVFCVSLLSVNPPKSMLKKIWNLECNVIKFRTILERYLCFDCTVKQLIIYKVSVVSYKVLLNSQI